MIYNAPHEKAVTVCLMYMEYIFKLVIRTTVVIINYYDYLLL